MLLIMGGFWRIYGFVEISVLGLLMVPSSYIQIIYVIPGKCVFQS